MTTTEHDGRLTRTPVAKAAMLIRKPVAGVLSAFADPASTTRFWFTKSNGTLEPGAHVRWKCELYGVPTRVAVKEIVPDRRIVIAWDDDNPTTIEWRFTPHTADTTFVGVTGRGSRGDGAALVAQALDSTGGFALDLAGLKALLEHGSERNLVGDRHSAEAAAE